MFIKGTTVHTSEGLRRIEALSVGDMVLTRPDDGTSEPVFREVEAVLREENCVIREVTTLGPRADTRYFYGASRSQLFRTPMKGWVPADKLRDGHRLIRADGSRGQVGRQFPVYRTKDSGVGWVQAIKRL